MGFSQSPASSPNGKPSKRADANRRNAKKSTGPRTPEGKTRSSLNAVKHGLTAQTAVLPGEDPAELEELSRSVEAQLRPAGAIQQILAERVVSLAWKLRRCAAAEADLARYLEVEPALDWKAEQQELEEMKAMKSMPRKLLYEMPPPPGLRTGVQSLVDEFLGRSDHKPMQRLTEYELKLETALRRTIHELRQIQKDENFLRGEEDAPRAEEPVQAAGAAAPETSETTENEPTSGSPTGCIASQTDRQMTPEQNEPIPPVVRDPEVTEPQPPPLPPDRN